MTSIMEFGRQHFCALLALTTIGFSGAMSLPAQSADFAGKTIEIIVPAGEGGGTDLWARFYVPVLQDYLPGNPTVVGRADASCIVWHRPFQLSAG
jgi:tripartite-type tricarboxylate transporter receptor subunit TctC